jgi:hypothetical protein
MSGRAPSWVREVRVAVPASRRGGPGVWCPGRLMGGAWRGAQARPTLAACSSLTSTSRRTTLSSPRRRAGAHRSATLALADLLARPTRPSSARPPAPRLERDPAWPGRRAGAGAATAPPQPLHALRSPRLFAHTPARPASGGLQDSHLSLQRQRQRPNLPGHPEGSVVSRPDHQQGVALHL